MGNGASTGDDNFKERYVKEKDLGNGTYGSVILVGLKENPEKKRAVRLIDIGKTGFDVKKQPIEAESLSKFADGMYRFGYRYIVRIITCFFNNNGSSLFCELEYCEQGRVIVLVEWCNFVSLFSKSSKQILMRRHFGCIFT